MGEHWNRQGKPPIRESLAVCGGCGGSGTKLKGIGSGGKPIYETCGKCGGSGVV